MFDKKRVLKWLVLVNLMLVVLYFISHNLFTGPTSTIRHWFDLDGEATIPAWFSSIQLFAISVLSIVYARQLKAGHLRKFYVLMGAVFLFFSADEAAKIHEGVTAIFKTVSICTFFPNAHGMWILVYPVLLIVLGLVFWKGLHLFLKEKTGQAFFLAGAIVFVAGGVGVEICGYFMEKTSLLYIVEVAIEESLELLGQSLMLCALLSKFSLRQAKVANL